MTDFLESPRFPDCVARGATGGPGYSVEITELRSGFEVRNNPWQYPRCDYDASTGIKEIEDLESVLNLYHVAEGPTMGFRYKDWLDYKSCPIQRARTMLDQTLVADLVADPTGKTYNLIKTYTWGSASKSRDITKPVAGTVVVADNGVLQSDPADYSVDTATGVIVFVLVPTGPVTAGYEYDVPVRFVDEHLPVQLTLAELGSSPINVIEIKIARS